MADTKISGATLTTAAATDLVPIARPADTTARHVTITSLVQAVAASTLATGAVELATDAEAKAVTSATLAVTPANIAAIFSDTISIGHDGQLRWSSETVDVKYNVCITEADFSGVKDPVLYWGWNIGQGARIDATKGGIWQQFEYDYYASSQHFMEWNFNAIDDSGNSERYMAFLVDKEDHDEAYWWFWIGNHANSFFLVTEAGTSNHLIEIYSKDDTPMVKIAGSINAPGGVTGGVDIRPTIISTAHPDLYGTLLNTTITVGDGSNVSVLSTIVIQPPTITLTGGSALLYPATLLVNGPPTTGTYPWALWVNGGNNLFSGNSSFGGGAGTTPTNPVDIVAGTLRQRVAKTPSAANDTGATGQICWDASYIYVCVNTNTWKRSEISTWI